MMKTRISCNSITRNGLKFVLFVTGSIHSAYINLHGGHVGFWQPIPSSGKFVCNVNYGTIWFSRRISGFGAPFDFHAPRRNCTSTLAAGTALFRREALAPPTRNFKYFPALSALIMKTFQNFFNYQSYSKWQGSNVKQVCIVLCHNVDKKYRS